MRAPVDPEVRERFLDFLSSPPGTGAASPSDDVGLDPEPAAEDEGELGALDGQAREATVEQDDSQEESTLEVTPEELAADLAARLYDVNQDLAVAYESWADLPPEGRSAILEQARWIADLLANLEAGGEEES